MDIIGYLSKKSYKKHIYKYLWYPITKKHKLDTKMKKSPIILVSKYIWYPITKKYKLDTKYITLFFNIYLTGKI